MSTLQQLQYTIDRAIHREVLGALPSSWTRAKLEATVAGKSVTTTQMSVQVDALGQSGIALVSDPLQDKVRELFLLNDQFNTGLQALSYAYSKDPDGRWAFTQNYKYV